MAAALRAGEGGGRLPGTDGRALGHAMTVQRWDATRWFTDRAFERSPFALGVSDPELRFLWINASSARVITHSQEQVLGKKYREALPGFDRTLFPEGDDKPYTDALADVARTGEPTRLITVFRPRGSDYANARGHQHLARPGCRGQGPSDRRLPHSPVAGDPVRHGDRRHAPRSPAPTTPPCCSPACTRWIPTVADWDVEPDHAQVPRPRRFAVDKPEKRSRSAGSLSECRSASLDSSSC